MTDNQSIAGELPAPEIRDLLVLLAGSYQRAAAGEGSPAPIATVWLRGACFTGRVVKLQENSRELILLLQTEDGKGLVYLPVGGILAVQVHNAMQHVGTLSDGKIEAMPGDPAPGRLQLQRSAKSSAASLSESLGFPLAVEIAWDTITIDDAHLRSLQAWLGGIPRAIRQVAEEHGASALQGPVAGLRVEHGGRPAVSLHGSSLVFTADLGGGRAGRLGHDKLVAAIDAAL